MRLPNFIIAGTEKAGTTSVFSHLARHPEAVASTRKETDFFRGAGDDAAAYARQFPEADDAKILFEASPGYLGEAEHVAPRMHAMLPEVKLLFILREPVDRFLSSYHFHRARLNLPRDLGFHEYLMASLAYTRGATDPGQRTPPLDPWFLKVLPFGRYAPHLRRFLALYPREQVRVAFHDDLRESPVTFMRELSGFLGIDGDFWETADLEPRNVTFSARRRWLHRIAIRTNDRLESVLQPRPVLKSRLLGLYRQLNRAEDVERRLSADDRVLLEAFYDPANRDLQALLGTSLPASWTGPSARRSPGNDSGTASA